MFHIFATYIKYIYINKIQQDATVRRSLFTANHFTCFGRPSHPSSGVHKTVTAASGTGRIMYLSNNLSPTWPPRCRKVVAQRSVPEATVTVL